MQAMDYLVLLQTYIEHIPKLKVARLNFESHITNRVFDDENISEIFADMKKIGFWMSSLYD
jgi:hypothetical protein